MTVDGLTGPGDPFEIELVDGPGGPVRNFVRREGSLRETVERAARRGGRDFLVEGQRRVSFAEFARLVWGTARALVDEQGLGGGDRVAIVGPNSIDWIVAAFAIATAGGVGVALNPQWTADELAFALADSGSRIVLGPGSGDEPPVRLPFAAVVRAGEEPPTVGIAEDDPFVILYTSGTTGRPKGCITTHRGTIAQVRSVILSGLLDREEPAGGSTAGPAREPVLLVSTPLFHVSGLHSAACLALATGMKTVLTTGRFDAEEVLRLIETERVTAWGAVPTMVQRVVESPVAATTDLSSLERLAIGGAPLPAATLERARATLGVTTSLGNGYGLTETQGPVTMNAGRSLERRPGSVGRPGPLIDLRITSPDGKVVAAGTIGEVELRGPTLTPGYWDRPEDNAAVWRDGWFRTGDLGYLDEDGYLFLVDRLKDMIIRGGENVYCAEVEDALSAAPDVDEAAVFGLADDDLGERVAAVVRLRPGAETDEGQLRAFLAPRLARYKIPDRIVFTADPLPRNATGKMDKRQLRHREERVVT